MRAVLLVLLIAACGDNTHLEDASVVPPTDGRIACEVVDGEPELRLQLVADGLARPVGLVSPPGDPRLFVVEQTAGRIRIIDPGDVLRDAPFLDIDDDTAGGYEQGLLTIAFHPGYGDNGQFYLSYARAGDDALVVEAWKVDPVDPYRADPGSRRVLLEVPHTKPYHYGSDMHFGADGLLYVSVGDGGPQRDPEQHGQARDTLRGKLLRIDVDHTDGDLPYAIPDDNPFVGEAGVRPEIFAYGLRNPWRFTIDRETQHLFIADVGFDSGEELDVIPAGTSGQDFGWSILEADECMDPGACDRTGLTPPLRFYAHLDGCAIVGGPVYRGCAMPGHHGKLFFGDFCDGWVHTLVYEDGAIVNETAHPGLQSVNLSAFGTDAGGEVYVMDFELGTVSRIVPR